MMYMPTALLLFTTVALSLATNSFLPTIDLGYEIHQATFNVRDTHDSHMGHLVALCIWITYLRTIGKCPVLQLLQRALCSTPTW